MKATLRLFTGRAQELTGLPEASVDLIVTSPPYPMIEMWDETFTRQDAAIGDHLEAGEGGEAFARMHALLDAVWAWCDRAVRPGGIACIVIGDATRTLAGGFQLYANHARILQTFLRLGYVALPDILWRKQTNAPNKFMGSGMLPVGAYVTYEHEHILVLRKGARRLFTGEEAKRLRRESAFFWEERNVWFSDLWDDVKGASQALSAPAPRDRSAAFPFDIPYRLVCMFSVKGDTVLDPFAGTGTTLAAALAAGRNAVGVEVDADLAAVARQMLADLPDFANAYLRRRLLAHLRFALERAQRGQPMKHLNVHYRFPVVTSQERELLLHDVRKLSQDGHQASDGGFSLAATYDEGPQADLVGLWGDREAVVRALTPSPSPGESPRGRR